MKIKKTCLAVLGSLLAMPASSAVFKVTYTGEVTNGYDYAGIFGAPVNSLIGDFTAVFNFDTDSPGAEAGETINQSYIQGVNPSHIGDIILTINGHSFSFGKYYSGIQVTNDYPTYDFGPIDEFNISASNKNFAESIMLRIWTSTGNYLNSKYIEPLDYFAQPGDSGDGYFVIRNPQAQDSTYLAGGTLRANHVSVIEAAVPEPAGWIMMIAGFGFAGSLMRRKAMKTNVRYA